jgi:hypothetical protein
MPHCDHFDEFFKITNMKTWFSGNHKFGRSDMIPWYHYDDLKFLFLFFFQILWCVQIGNHPQEELAKFGHKTR